MEGCVYLGKLLGKLRELQEVPQLESCLAQALISLTSQRNEVLRALYLTQDNKNHSFFKPRNYLPVLAPQGTKIIIKKHRLRPTKETTLT